MLASTLLRIFLISFFRHIDQSGQLIWFYWFVMRFGFPSASALSRAFLVSFLLPFPVLSIFLLPGRAMVVDALLTIPIDYDAILFGRSI